MPLVLTVGNPKGGAGKTTVCLLIASCLAQRGASVLVLDTDEQLSAMQWMQRNQAVGLTSDKLTVEAIASEAQLVSRLRGKIDQDVVLIDVKGERGQMVQVAAGHSALVIIPTKASHLDLPEVLKFLNILDATFGHIKPVDARVVLNEVDGLDARQKPFKDAVEFIRAHKIPFFNSVLRRRSVFKSFTDGGHGGILSEMAGNRETIDKACENVLRFVAEIMLIVEPAEAEA